MNIIAQTIGTCGKQTKKNDNKQNNINMININITDIQTTNYEGNLIVLCGDELSRRALPLKKNEYDHFQARREAKPDTIAAYDRLPYRLYLVSCNPDQPTEQLHEHLRRSAAKLRKTLVDDQVASIALTGQGLLTEDLLAFVEGLVIADYSYDRFKTKTPQHIESLQIDSSLVTDADLQPLRNLWNRMFWCREWVNTPVANLNAAQFADELKLIARDLKVSCTVLDKKQIESLRMGGLIAVNQGSVDEPRFVALEYKPKKHINRKPLALVGKGIMYDTGGLNIKPDDYMQEMKSDMAGAATMASVLFAAADNNLPIWAVALLPLTDNRPGFNAYAADDILTMYDGTTVEVVNTDAEGRLVLADAIAYAVDKYQPALLIDIATLTGAASRAIGPYGIAAMHQHADNAMNLLKIMGEQVYERIAELPFWEEYDELLKSEMADLKNCGTNHSGAITAGKFLAHFAGDTPYIHLDIAGVAYFTKPQTYFATGASAYGMRLLYAFMQVYDALEK